MKDIDCTETKRPKDCPLVEVDTCDDTVSREAVKNILPRQKFVSYEAYLSCAADVDKLPSVTPAQKLEQESILNKIRADVSARYPKNYAGEPELGGSACEFSLNRILQIIDKYKAEMESEE